MSVTITAANRLTYQDGFMSRVEDMSAGLWPLIPKVQVEGEMKRIDFIDVIDGVQSGNTRFAPIVTVDPVHTNRWISTSVNYQAVQVDPKDVLNIMQDPKSEYMVKMQNAFMRHREDVVIEAFDATVTTGVRGGTTTAFPGSQQINAGGTNLTLDKLSEALYMLESRAYADQDLGQTLYFVYSPKQKQSLLQISEIVNTDYAQHKRLESGQVSSFYGFTFISSNRLIAGDGLGAGLSTSRECYAFTADAMLGGEGLAKIVDVYQDKKLVKHPYILYVQEDIGCIRKEEEKVVKVLCDETA